VIEEKGRPTPALHRAVSPPVNAQISRPGFGRSFKRVPTQGEAVTKGSPGGKHPTGKGAVRSPAFRLSAASRKAAGFRRAGFGSAELFGDSTPEGGDVETDFRQHLRAVFPTGRQRHHELAVPIHEEFDLPPAGFGDPVLADS
jgi:hypothetical protein